MQKSFTFAAIDIGSYEMGMKIFELSRERGVRELDHTVHRVDLGTETYATGHISAEHVREIVQILKEYQEIMKEYGVYEYRAFGTSALRETKDIDIVLHLLQRETGVEVRILSNSEQRFLNYKAVALAGETFHSIIEEPTAILDLGGGSIQLSVFDKDKLIATQNMRLGILRLQQLLQTLDADPLRMRPLMAELAGEQIDSFIRMYLREREVRNLIIVDDYVAPFIMTHTLGAEGTGFLDTAELSSFLEENEKLSRMEVARRMDIPMERIPLMKISALLIEHVAGKLSAKRLWAPGATLTDGIAYDYAEEKKMIAPTHDFERDIIASAQNMSKRYMCGRKRTDALMQTALPLFDVMKHLHGFKDRERLLLQIAVILLDCGKYISMLNMAESAYHIIMSTEMIGLSHREREIIANVVWMTQYTGEEKAPGERYMAHLPGEDRLMVAKLAALLRLSASLVRTREKKFSTMQIRRKERELVITADRLTDDTVERGLLSGGAALFTEVYGIVPVIRHAVKN